MTLCRCGDNAIAHHLCPRHYKRAYRRRLGIPERSKALPDTPPTERELTYLTAWLREGGYAPAARALGVWPRSIAYAVESVLIRLQVDTPSEAAQRLGIITGPVVRGFAGQAR